MNIRIGKLQVKKRFVLFVVAALILIGVTVSVCVSASLKTTIYWGSLDNEGYLSGVIVRDETFYPYGEYGRIDRIVSEGQRVAVGDVIADFYSKDYISSKLDDLTSQRRNIVSYQQNIMKTVNDEEINRLTVEISVVRARMVAAAQARDNEETVACNRYLCELIDKQNELLRLRTKADEHLSTLYALEAALEKTISTWKSELVAQRDGVVSFSGDGYESTLNGADIQTVSVSEVYNVLSKKTGTSAGEGYRIVNTDKWYIILTGNAKSGLTTGQTYALYRRGSGEAVEGVLLSEINDGTKHVCVFACTGEMGNLIDARTADFYVGTSAEGLVVPTSSILTANGLRAIYVEKHGQKELVYVEVVTTGGDKAIVRPMPGEVEPCIGQKVYR